MIFAFTSFSFIIFFYNWFDLKSKANFLSIKTIKIKANQCLNNFAGLDFFKQKNFFIIFFNKEKLKKNLQLLNPQIRTVEIDLPSLNELLLEIDCFFPIAFLKQDGYFLYLSEDGKILFKKKENTETLPEVFYYQKISNYSYKPGDWLNFKDLKVALTMIKALTDLGYNPQNAEVKSEDFIILKLNNKNIIFSSNKDESQQKLELTEILKQFKIKGRDFQKLDLRFNKPVVVF
ncbi:MAG: cell division protein FtsQ/DivIB [Microgenomates group bacterium]